jgi:hypothetical protein
MEAQRYAISMSTIRFGATHEYQILRREEVRSRWTQETALRFLGRFKNDPTAMAGFRKLVTQARSDQDVLTGIARMMVSGQLLIVEQRGIVDHNHLSLKIKQEEQPAPAPQRVAEPEQEEEAATFAAEHDGQAQAATLVAAARSGVPFCEECARDEAEAA